MPEFTLHQHKVHFKEVGAGTPILFGHSSTSTGGQWKALIETLSSQYRCLAPDHIGYGRSDVYKGDPALIPLEVDILEQLLPDNNEAVHLIGHSYGGSLVARLALRYPERIRTLTLVEPTFFHLLASFGKTEAYREITAVADRSIQFVKAGDPREAARGFIGYWVGPTAFDAMPEKIQAAVAAGMAKVAEEWTAIIPNTNPSAGELTKLSCPKLLIHGGKTTLAARSVTEIMHELWPDAAFWQLDGASHMLPVTHPEQVNTRIVQFLKSIDEAQTCQ